MEDQHLFKDFLGEEIKMPYREGRQFKIASGRLVDIRGGFVKVTGKLGTIIVNIHNIERITKVKLAK